MDDLPLQKIAISGPTLASMIQRISTSHGDVDGLLFGHVTHPTISSLSDDDPSTSSATTLIATITSFVTTTTTSSFYDSTGQIDPIVLRRLLLPSPSTFTLIGWFSGRRRTHLRPSLREFSVSHSFSSKSQLSFPVQNSTLNSSPSLFLLFATPLSDQFIHTHDYRAYQFHKSSNSFEPKSIDIVNIGPAFRGHYGSFSPNSPFPLLHCETRASPMAEDRDERSLIDMKRVAKDQSELDMCAEGFEIGGLSRLMGSEAANYTVGLEDLYEKMLAKLEGLARLVEKSSAKVLEQEDVKSNSAAQLVKKTFKPEGAVHLSHAIKFLDGLQGH